jgi:hypothetical protein
MSQQSYIVLELDTTPPEIEIYAPRYTTREILNEIKIISNEKLSAFQDIYIIDSKNNRHDYTFEYSENEFIGFVQFNELSYGMATIYVTVKDEVYNRSALVSKTIEIKESLSRLNVSISDSFRSVTIKEHARNIKTEKCSRNMNTSEQIRNATVKEETRNIQIHDTDTL